ncbi:MAG: M24 family metallopeptidase [Desulfobacula sp.]|nr:M24 family metallopeptidase [Desulfobacula sp.]
MRTPVFEISEYKERIKKTKLSMEKSGLEVMISTLPQNMYYLSGYDCGSFYVHQGVIVSIDKEEPIWFGRGMDANGAKITTWLKQENIREYGDDYVQSTVKHPMDFVGDILKENGWDKKVIGLEMDQYYFTAQAYLSIKASLPNAVFQNANLLVNWVRLIKSDNEIAYMKKAGKIVEKAMGVAMDSIRSGVRQCDVAGKVLNAQMAGTKEFGGDYTSVFPVMASGIGTTAAHMSWSDEKYNENEVSYLEIAGCKKRYHAPLCRTIYTGKPPQALIDKAKSVIDGLNETLDFVKPGISCEEVEAKWRSSISKSKIVKKQRMAYPIGIGYPPDWGEQTVSMRPGDKTILKPNMTFHMIPAIWQKYEDKEDLGFIISESLVVTENGCETLADFPRKLFVSE